MTTIIKNRIQKNPLRINGLTSLLLMVMNLQLAYAGKDCPTSSHYNYDLLGKSHCPNCEKPAPPPAADESDDTPSWRKHYESTYERWKREEEGRYYVIPEPDPNDEMAQFGRAWFFGAKTADPNPTKDQTVPERITFPDIKQVAQRIEQETLEHQKKTQQASEELEKEKKAHDACIKDLAESFQDQKKFFEKSKAIKENIREHLTHIDPKEANALNRAITGWDYRKASPEMIAAACSAENLAQASAYYEEKASETLQAAHEIAKEALGLSLHELTSAAKALVRPSEMEAIAHSIEYADIARELALALVDVGTSVTPGVSTARDAYELITGKSLITGDELSDLDRTLAGLNLATLGIGHVASGTLKVAEKIGHLAAANQRIGAIEHGLESSIRSAEHILESSIVPGGAKNRAAHEHFLKEMREAMERPHVEDPKLFNFMKNQYRRNAEIGSGSTAAAIRHELTSGDLVKGKTHIEKGQNDVRGLRHWLKENPTARPGDRAAAENVLKDLVDSLGDLAP
ncbi:MAG: pre-toxin TG domain-containing protein [Bdellovibrionia bacterium]